MSFHGRNAPLAATIAAFLAILAFFALPATAATVERGPYLQVATPDSIIIRWRTGGTDPATQSVVRYGTVLGSPAFSAIATPQKISVLGAGDVARTVTEHEVPLADLAPNTRYYYSVGDDGGTNAGGDATYSFVTPPLPGTEKPTRIWVIGDAGTANSDQAAVRDAFKAKAAADSRPADLWLMLGDNAYNEGKDYQYEAAVFDMYPEILRQAPVWPTRGNHDMSLTLSNDADSPYYQMFTLPKAGEAGGLLSGTEAYYSYDYANIHFIVLDSFGWTGSPTAAMLSWLESDLQATTQEWVIAYWHHPPYTKGSHNSDTEGRLIEMRETVLPILEDYGVDLVLGGHSHSYERSYLLAGHYGVSGTFDPATMKVDGGNGREGGDGAYFKDPALPVTHDGAVYAVAGSSGKVSSGSLNHPAMYYSAMALGSLVVDVDGSRLDAVFINQAGAVLDSFTMIHGDDTTPPSIQSVDAGDANTVFVTFSERVDAADAGNPANYAIDQGAIVTGAAYDNGTDRATLTTSPLVEGVTYLLTVANVADLSGNPIAPVSTAPFELHLVQTRSFQDGVAPDSGYLGTRDVYLRQTQPDANLNGEAQLLADGDDGGGQLVALVKWDTSSIPADAVVEAASIDLGIFNPSAGTYALRALLKPWSETGATWNSRDAGLPWEVPGAAGATDRGAAVLGTLSPSATGTATVQLNADGLAAVAGWIADPSQNFGVIIASTGTVDGIDVYSREAAPLQRPALHLTYSLPATGGDIEPPSVPTGLTAVAQSQTSVALAWQASTDDTGVAGYDVYRGGNLITTTAATGMTDSGLAPGTTYSYTVDAFDAAGNTSTPSAPATATTPSPPPATVSSFEIAMQIKLFGRKSTAAGAVVTVVDETGARVAGATVSGTWGGLAPASQSAVTGTTGEASFTSPKVAANSTGEFTFTVTNIAAAGHVYDPAANQEGADCIDTDGVECSSGPVPPPPPSGVGTSVSGSTVTVSWSAVAGATGYRVYRKGPGDIALVAIATTAATSHADAGLADGTYDYAVTSLDSAGPTESAFSGTTSATVGTVVATVLHVPAFGVTAESKGKNWWGATTISVLDPANAPAAGATVTGNWTLLPATGGSISLGTVSGVTGSDGRMATESSRQRAGSGDRFRFTVSGVSRGSDTFNAGGSTLTGDAIVP